MCRKVNCVQNGCLLARKRNPSAAPAQTSQDVKTVDINNVGVLGQGGGGNHKRAGTPLAGFSICLGDPVLPHFNANVLLWVFQSVATIYYESAYLRGDVNPVDPCTAAVHQEVTEIVFK